MDPNGEEAKSARNNVVGGFSEYSANEGLQDGDYEDRVNWLTD